MTSQASLTEWADTQSTDEDKHTNEQDDDDTISESLRQYADQLKEARIKPIPQEEQYPKWKGKLKSHGNCPKTLGEEDSNGNRPYAYADREDNNVEEHFVTIHNRF